MQKGFTLIELLVVIGIVILIGAAAMPFYYRFLSRSAVGTTYNELLSELRKAQMYAMLSKQDGPWGVHYQTGNIILFQGGKFAGRNTAYDEVFPVNSTITVGGISDIVFSQVTGITNTTTTITIRIL